MPENMKLELSRTTSPVCALANDTATEENLDCLSFFGRGIEFFMSQQPVQIEGLKPKDWYLLRRGDVEGPMMESEIRDLLLDSELDADAKVKQGDSEFLPASKIRDMFVALAAQGWYVIDEHLAYGPFVGPKLLTLIDSNFFTGKGTLVRQGKSGRWVPLHDARQKLRVDFGHSVRKSVVHSPSRGFSYAATCRTCGRKVEGPDRNCQHCTELMLLEQAELKAKRDQPQVNKSELADNMITKALLLAFAFATAGFFVSQWMVNSVVWRSFYNRSDQEWGWASLAIGLILTSVGVYAIRQDSSKGRDRKMVLTSLAALFLVGLPYFAVKSFQLNAEKLRVDSQQQMWERSVRHGVYDEQDE